jgi:hypothetical protein
MTVDDLLRDAAATLHEEVRAGVDAPAALARVTARPRRRRLPLVAAAVLLVVLVGAVVVATAGDDDGEPVASEGRPSSTAQPAIVGGPDPGEAVGLAITADPATGLAAGDRVEVTVEGLPNADVSVVMCAADALDREGIGGCDLDLGGESIIGPDGRLDGTTVVKRQLALEDGTVIDCAVEGARCAIGVVGADPTGEPGSPEVLTLELLGLVGVAFTPAPPDPAPVLTVDPGEGIAHGEVVTISGVGFTGSVGHVDLCQAGGGLCTMVHLGGMAGAELRTDDEGRFAVEVPLWRVFPANVTTTGDPSTVDCADRGCTVTVTDDVGRTSVPVAVSFADGPAPEPPTLEVDPATGLRVGAELAVTVRGLAPGAAAMVLACSPRAEAPDRGCGRSSEIGTVVADDDGVGTTTVTAPGPEAYDADCTVPDVCTVALTAPRDGPGDPLISAATPVPVRFAPR